MKFIRITFLIIVVLFSISCKNKIPIKQDEDMVYKLTKLELVAHENSINNDCETISRIDVLRENDSCKYNNLIIYLHLNEELISDSTDGQAIINDTLKNVIVTSDNDYNENYLKGDTLNDIVNIQYRGGGLACNDEKFCMKINDYIEMQPKSTICHLNIYFTEAPSVERQHRFVVTYEETSGSKFVDTMYYGIYIQP